ncbi:MAG: phage baseplate assembly protein V [Marinobacterium sp.]|nr:phage baseplate assembly protein V [Marinobacterium sp.]
MIISNAELHRQLNNLLRLGTIAEVDHSRQLLRVKTGELLTDWLDWPAEMGRNYIRWRPLRIGTKVLLASPAGDPAQALIIGMLYTNALPTPSDDPALDLIQFDDGSFVKHNADSGLVHLHAAGDLYLTADGIVRIQGKEVYIN